MLIVLNLTQDLSSKEFGLGREFFRGFRIMIIFVKDGATVFNWDKSVNELGISGC